MPPCTIAWGCVAPLLCPADRGAARLACSDLLHAIDAAHPITALRIVPWRIAQGGQQHAPSARLQDSVVRVEAGGLRTLNDWRELVRFLCSLQRLAELRVHGRRTWFSWPPPPPQQDAWHALRTVSFDGSLEAFTELSSLAPGLQRVQCHSLVLRGSQQGAGSGVLPRVTHLAVAGDLIIRVSVIRATDKEEAAEALARALPALQVVSELPRVRASVSGEGTTLSTAVAFARCSQLRAVRSTFDSSTNMYGLLAVLARLPSLRHVVVHGRGPAEDMKGARGLTQLSTLSLTFACGRSRSHCIVWLLQELASLRQLQQLALPAKLLCVQCCGGRAAQALADLLTTCADCEHQLRELVFLVRAPAPAGQRQAGYYCPHAAPAGELAALVHGDTAALRAAVAAAALDGAGASAATEAARDAKARRLRQPASEDDGAEPFSTAVVVYSAGDPGGGAPLSERASEARRFTRLL